MAQGGLIMRYLLVALAGVVLTIPAALAQNVISAKAGLVHVVEGDVYLNDQKIQPKITEFPDIKEGNILKTGEGRVEVLLSPGAFLRMAEDSSFQMVSTRLADVRLEALKGSTLIEVAELLKENGITVVLKDATVALKKPGLYRFDSDPYDIKVYDGEASVQSGDKFFTLKDGRQLTAADGAWTASRFDKEDGDALYRWAKRRSSYVAMANVSAARQARTNGDGTLNGNCYGNGFGYGYGYGYGYMSTVSNNCASYPAGWRGGGWVFNPYYGMYTYLPMNGMMYSPFGWSYWSPRTVQRAYYPAAGGGGGGIAGRPATAFTPHYDNNLGYMTTGARSSGGSYSGAPASGGAASGGAVSAGAPSAGAAGGARGGSGSAGRGGGGGRGQ
jgi:hypothetical protein